MISINKRFLVALWATICVVCTVACSTGEFTASTPNEEITPRQNQEETHEKINSNGSARKSSATDDQRESEGSSIVANGAPLHSSGKSDNVVSAPPDSDERAEADSDDSAESDSDENAQSEVDSNIDETPIVKRSLYSLDKASSCDDVLTRIKERVKKEVEETLDRNLEFVLDIINGEPDCSFLGASKFDLLTLNGSLTESSQDESGASEYSTTNVQVAGVDEADFVKNDDNYIYVVANGRLQIIDAWPVSDAHPIGSVTVMGTPQKLYVEGDRAVVYSSLESIDLEDGTSSDTPIMRSDNYQQECTYGYSCDFTGDGRRLLIQTYDISDKTDPVLVRETEFSGSYLNSRKIGSIVHTVVSFPEIAMPRFVYWPEELNTATATLLNLSLMACWYDEVTGVPPTSLVEIEEEEVREMFDRLRTINEQAIDEITITDFLPGVRDARYIGDDTIVEEGLLNDCGNFYLSQAGDGRGFLSLISFDMSALDAIGTTTIVGKPGAVYASKEALYVAVRHYRSRVNQWFFTHEEAISEATTVHKFALSQGSIETVYRGSGVARGRVLNQFSMDEHQGYLRIATSTGQVPNPNVHSTLSVLTEDDGALDVVGMVDNIAPNEDIRSVRFNGDVGFIVTFKKTDPLFVIDLSDPCHPEIKAELKVPGFATYMHLMDDTHLVTMGYDADDTGNFAWFQGLQLRLLDVSELDEPVVLSEETIGTRGSTSDAATNHLAFNYFPQRDLLALPMTLCEGGPGGGSYGDIMTFSGLLVYRMTVDDGFELLGGVPHESPETVDNYGSGCRNWWTNSNSKVKRSIFMSSDVEDFVYSIAMDLINVSKLDDLEHPIVSIDLTSE